MVAGCLLPSPNLLSGIIAVSFVYIGRDPGTRGSGYTAILRLNGIHILSVLNAQQIFDYSFTFTHPPTTYLSTPG